MNKQKYDEVIKSYLDKSISREDFENSINILTEELESPLKEFYRIFCYLYNNYYVPKDRRNYLIEYAMLILESKSINDNDKDIIKCALMNAYFAEYNYIPAEKYAKNLLENDCNNIKILKELASYYTKTRRYSIADDLYNMLKKYNTEEIKKDYDTYIGIVTGTKNAYLPALLENREKYFDFMNYLGIDVEKSVKSTHKKQPEKIKVGEYPIPIETSKSGFLDFVAFDLETTGVDSSKDAITEIAAIKVVNGEIKEEKEFIFQELVKPYKKRIPENVENITGITNDMVCDARKIWEVFPDFADFIGDNILVGYNCMIFDSKFLVRAGRLSNLIIYNKYFDVMKMAQKYKRNIDSKNMTLVEFGEALGIKNPQAHRALADAITTAKIYLKLLEM